MHDIRAFAPLFRLTADRIKPFLDKGNVADAIREEIANADIEAVIPMKSNRRESGSHDKVKYKGQDQIELQSPELSDHGPCAGDGVRFEIFADQGTYVQCEAHAVTTAKDFWFLPSSIVSCREDQSTEYERTSQKP